MSEICARCLELTQMLADGHGRELVQLSKVDQLRSERDLALRRVEDLEEQVADLRRSLARE